MPWCEVWDCFCISIFIEVFCLMPALNFLNLKLRMYIFDAVVCPSQLILACRNQFSAFFQISTCSVISLVLWDQLSRRYSPTQTSRYHKSGFFLSGEPFVEHLWYTAALIQDLAMISHGPKAWSDGSSAEKGKKRDSVNASAVIILARVLHTETLCCVT